MHLFWEAKLTVSVPKDIFYVLLLLLKSSNFLFVFVAISMTASAFTRTSLL